jgi:hypothetical protein
MIFSWEGRKKKMMTGQNYTHLTNEYGPFTKRYLGSYQKNLLKILFNKLDQREGQPVLTGCPSPST